MMPPGAVRNLIHFWMEHVLVGVKNLTSDFISPCLPDTSRDFQPTFFHLHFHKPHSISVKI